MGKQFFVFSMVIVLGTVGTGSLEAEVANPRIASWSNSKTTDQKTVFAVEQGEEITFTVKAEVAEKYLWHVNGKPQQAPNAESFKWTVPDKKGMWKISVKTTNKARRQWVRKRAAFWNKWVEGKGKEKFIRGMTDVSLYPVKGQTEWIVSTFLKRVNPGESIQEAIDSLPPEGGVVELADGTHEVNDAMYPAATFYQAWDKKRKHPVKYSIIIKRSNVTVCGTHKSVVRQHDNSAYCFYVPKSEPPLENITFRGFTLARTVMKKDRSRNAMILVSHAKNITVEEMHGTTRAYASVIAGGNENVTIRNNKFEHCGIGAAGNTNIRVLNNVILGCPRKNYALATDQHHRFVYVIGNRVINAGANSGLLVDGHHYCLMSDNFVRGSQASVRMGQSIYHAIIENNTFTEASRYAVMINTQLGMRKVLIRNNLIYNNRKVGILVTQYKNPRRLSRVVLTNNVIYNNGGDGIRKITEHVLLDVSNNIIAGNKGYGINYPADKITLSHNDVWNNLQGNYHGGCTAGPGDFSRDPLFADPSKGDFHLKSKAGRWDPKAKKWVKDEVQSPCIDAGNPKVKTGSWDLKLEKWVKFKVEKADCSMEPVPNGGRGNVGAYGNTKEASKSPNK
ncbi:MAG: right-handed parallel beta-helix repeat-containing protein [Phycisphaerae bacterium]|nr:right-handed parallel beta-helix repeat-containing protein [Phycisphaerae bacterium]